MSEHTSGPWIIGDGFSVDGQYLILGNLDDEGGNAHTVVCDINEDPDEWHANALLIAAAPDLYEALNGMVGLIQLLRGRNDLPAALRPILDELNPNCNHRITAANAALAKVSQQSVSPHAQGQQNEGAES